MATDQHDPAGESEHEEYAAQQTGAEPPEPPRLRALRRLVAFLTATLALGMIAIVGILLVRLTSAPQVPLAPLGTGVDRAIPLPPGAALRSIGADAGRLYLHVEGPQGTRILIHDAARGAPIGQYRVIPGGGGLDAAAPGG